MTRITAGLFHSQGDAERAADRLVHGLGIGAREVEVHAAQAGEGAATRAWRREPLRSLISLSLPSGDHRVYAEAVRRGGILVTARVEEDQLDRAMTAPEERGAVDLGALEAEWRRAGWTGYTGHDEDVGFATYGQDAMIGHIPRGHYGDAPAGAPGRAELAAPRREVGRTRARVCSYVREPNRSWPD